MADLSINIAGIRFKNPVWMASGEPTATYDKMKRAIDAGVSAVVAKSFCGACETGHEKKRPMPLAKFCFLDHDRRVVWGKQIPRFYMNYTRSGLIQWCPDSEDEWIEKLVKAEKYAVQFDAHIIGSVFGTTHFEDMIRPAKKMEQAGLKAVEFDLGCPNVDMMVEKGALIKISQGYVEIVQELMKQVTIPIFIKLTPQQPDLVVTSKAVKAAGAAAVTCLNRFLGFCIDIEKEKPYTWGWGSVGGPWMLPIASRWISEIYKADEELPIIASSGACNAEDVARFHLAGATAVEFCGTVMLRGYSILKESIEGLSDFLDSRGYKSVQDIIGIATRASHNYEEMYSIPEYVERSSIDQDKCIHCGRCIAVCWYDAIERKGKEKAAAPCKEACPAGVGVPRYVHAIANGRFKDALAIVVEKIPFPAVCGTVCLHPCEAKCARGRLDEPIAIMDLKRFVAQRGGSSGKLKKNNMTGKRVAVIGAGPAGLTAAYYLARLGHDITVFEASAVPGGMLRVIPEYRLPGNIIDKDITRIEEAGVRIKTNTNIESLDEIQEQGYNAIFIATGAHRESILGIEGESVSGVMTGLSFLNRVKSGKKTELGARVAVIGGGNTAIDAARTASRLGASEITIFYRRSRDEMPASDEDIEDALSEGVDMEFLVAPTRIQRNNGHLALKCIRRRLGKPDASGRPCPKAIRGSESTFEIDTIIPAIGEMSCVPAKFGLKQTKDGVQINPATMAASKDGVFAGGDAVTGSASIIEAIAAGRKAATSIDKFLGGKGIIDEKLEPVRRKVKPLNEMEPLGDEGRVPAASLSIAKRIKSFDEVKLGYNSALAIKEAKRCLHCDANWVYTVNQDKCQGCYNCRVICPIEGCIAIKSKSL